MGGPMIVGASIAMWGRKALVAYTEAKRDRQIRELQARATEAEILSQVVHKLTSETATIVSFVLRI